ncbi:ABERRANT POLLEN DEVELOPMENT 1 [Hibiscus trionum]|uniref:ABERRANT POLLEN DEVELOPMENT 1 n=1 Tax=Hibiscus trionum TaxID=183268 RepID=A0A9W7LXD6_HIBTR|nr:ABERRANT POLLEN DEVELOPMENT 1 [Hibiscus trionum]
MFRSGLVLISHPAQLPRLQDTWARFILPITLWLCVSVTLRFGCYGDRRMVLGPNSSVLMKASPVFVQQVEVRNENGEGALVYGFSEKPELNKEVNWSSSSYLVVESYNSKGYSLWLNKGSKICMQWATQTSGLDKTEIVLVKGGRRQDPLLPTVTFPFIAFFLNELVIGKQAEYTIDADDKYYVGVINSSPRSLMMTFNLSVTSMVYDVTKARNMCSTLNGSCRFDLQFPDMHYVVVSTPDDTDIDGLYVEVSFIARFAPYIAVLGFSIIFILLVLKSVAVCDRDADAWMEKSFPQTYGMTAVEEYDGKTGYDEKVCIICYDDERSCFFVPCGHCATCYDCAQRVMEENNKMCPICRKPIQEVRKLFTP